MPRRLCFLVKRNGNPYGAPETRRPRALPQQSCIMCCRRNPALLLYAVRKPATGFYHLQYCPTRWPPAVKGTRITLLKKKKKKVSNYLFISPCQVCNMGSFKSPTITRLVPSEMSPFSESCHKIYTINVHLPLRFSL